MTNKSLDLDDERTIGIGEVEQMLALSRVTVYRYIKAGTFPEGFKIGGGRRRWYLRDVKSYLDTAARA